MLNESNCLAQLESAMKCLPKPTRSFSGRGVVIPAGGTKYFICAWVCIRMLRRTGCVLPIQLWHLGPKEMTEEMRGLIEPFGVECVDARQLRAHVPARILNGWELKAYAIQNSPFQEVLLLDADNVPVVDPTFLFCTPEYVRHGAVFWPDYGRLSSDRSIWRLTGVAYRNEPEFETGQIVVDKQRCWDALALTMWMNEHSDFFYKHVHGDKETFHLAWRKLGQDYAMPLHPIESLQGVMCQHDFSGRRIFQHRNFQKWTLDKPNVRVSGFVDEECCIEFLAELDRAWKTRRDRRFRADGRNPAELALADRLCSGTWLYRRVHHDERPMSFLADGSVDTGTAACERTWNLLPDACGHAVLHIYGEKDLTCILNPRDGHWEGAWLVHEKMPIVLTPLQVK